MWTREKLEQKAKDYEPLFWCPEGRHMDGVPYRYGMGISVEEMDEFLEQAVKHLFGGRLGNISRVGVAEMIAAGNEIDLVCGNSWIWAILNKLEVSRVRSQGQFDEIYGK